MSKLLLIDGNAVLHRAYYALPDWRNRSGEATAGVYGFLSMLQKTTAEISPTHLVVVFDHPGPTFRNELYVGYQSKRMVDEQVAKDIHSQVEKLKQVFAQLNVTVFQIDGVEADDVIGSVAVQTIKQKKTDEIVIITGDRDLMQLVNSKVKLYMPQKGLSDGVLIDGAKVKEKLGINPAQVVDYKALVGDTSDNYPGVTGIGPKTAVQLLDEFKNFESIYAEIDNPKSKKINESLKKRLREGREGGMLSKKLATIKTDVSISLNLDHCLMPANQKFSQVFSELGYKSLVRRAGGGVSSETDSQQKLF